MHVRRGVPCVVVAAPPEHMGSDPFKVKRDVDGKPMGAAFQANVMKPDEVPGAYEAWLKDQ